MTTPRPQRLDVGQARRKRDVEPQDAVGTPSTPLTPETATPSLATTPAQGAWTAPEIQLLAERYLLLERVDGAPASGGVEAPRRCIDTVTEETLVCRQVSLRCNRTAQLMEAHRRLADYSDRVTCISRVIRVTPESSSDAGADEQLYLLSPASYGDLHSYLRSKRRLREPEARALFRQAAEAVHHCHSHGVVLTDLKLRRFVFADPQRTQLRLESLEDAIVLERCDSDDGVWRKHGYPAYVTPEVLMSRGARYSGRAADLWSLGIILYTLLVGRYPFQDAGPLGLFTKIIRGHFQVPDYVSSRARCLIRQLLRRHAHHRLQACDILRHHWFSATLRTAKADQSKSKPAEAAASLAVGAAAAVASASAVAAAGAPSSTASSAAAAAASAPEPQDHVVPQWSEYPDDEPRMSADY